MTWEEKLFELLEMQEPVDFQSDSDKSEVLMYEKSPAFLANKLEEAIKAGDFQAVTVYRQRLETSVSKWRQIIRHCKKNPQCVNWNSYSFRYYWKEGVFRIGCSFAPEGLGGFVRSMLHWSRLVRDAEIRVRKHPRYKRMEKLQAPSPL